MDGTFARRFQKRLFALLPEREIGGDWKGGAKNLGIELLGHESSFRMEPLYWELRGKVLALPLLEFREYKTAIFDCCSLLTKVIEMENKKENLY